MELKQVSTKEEIEGILDLQIKNLRLNSTITKEQQKSGFLTVKHDFDILQRMNDVIPHIVAIDKAKVIGYALSMDRMFSKKVPVLTSMFDKIDSLEYNDISLSKSNYYVMGQICVDEQYRGQGILSDLYLAHRKYYSHKFDFFMTDISASNPKSLKAHINFGFKIINSFSNEYDDWDIVIWDWK